MGLWMVSAGFPSAVLRLDVLASWEGILGVARVPLAEDCLHCLSGRMDTNMARNGLTSEIPDTMNGPGTHCLPGC